MDDTRHDDLMSALEAKGWLAGEWHQRHDLEGNRAIEFHVGEARIGVMAAPHRAARTKVTRVARPDPNRPPRMLPHPDGNRLVAVPRRMLVTLREEIPAFRGAGYRLRLDAAGATTQVTAKDAAAAIAQLERWRAEAA